MTNGIDLRLFPHMGWSDMGVGLPMQWVGLGVTVGMGGENIQMSNENYT